MSLGTETRPTPCRGCGAAETHAVLDYGLQPIADQLVEPNDLGTPEARHPLALQFCRECALLQLVDVLPPDTLYRGEYTYFTSELPTLDAHFSARASRIIDARGLTASNRVIEAASNDGYMLRVFADRGVQVLGIDPAEAPARKADERGIRTLREFFGTNIAATLRDEGEVADVLIGNNVLNLIADPNEFVEAASMLLAPDGIAVVEVPYAVTMCERGEYDLVYHQNASYFSLTALIELFARHDLVITDVEFTPNLFGGSICVEASRGGAPSDAMTRALEYERTAGVRDQAFYDGFADRARESREQMRELLDSIRAKRGRIAVYGAGGGMATTFLNFHGLDGDIVEYAIDANPRKHGRYTAGSRLEIHPPERLLEDRPDFVLVLARNYADEIIGSQREYRARGGRFITALPELRVWAPDEAVESKEA